MDWASGGNGSGKLDSDGGGRGMEDAGDGMDDRVLEEAPASASANNKRKSTVPPSEGGGTKKAKREKGSKAGGSGGPGHNGKLARRSHASGIVVANNPNIPCRYGHLLRMITCLLPYKSQGKAYECYLNRIDTLIKWSRCNQCLFFEWLREDRKMLCWIFNTMNKTCVKFLVNPAFASVMSEVKVKRATCAFSLNFFSDETWVGVKQTLEMMFCPSQNESSSDAPDNLYVFTRINDCVYFRNMKIEKLPDIAHGESLVLKEVGPYFCLKLVGIRGENAVPHLASDVPQSQIKTELNMCPILYYSLSPELGSCTAVHSLHLNGEKYLILLESGQNLSVFEGYSISLRDFLEDQSFLKTKHIVGSKTEEVCLFVRNMGKSIIGSILDYFIELFSRCKCIKMEKLKHTQILLKGCSSVKLHGAEVVDYDENLAKQNVVLAVELIKGCFPQGSIPCDLAAMLSLLLEDPLRNLQAAKGDSSLLSAKGRRELLVLLHTEYMTNVNPKLSSEERSDFFKGCPYLHTWMDTMERNTYLTAVANYNGLLGDLKMKKRDREKKNEREMVENSEEENVLEGTEDRDTGAEGGLQLCIMRNCDVHIPENAIKDGISPFRLSWSDYIRTFYYPMYLSFIQRRMAQYMKPPSIESAVDEDEVPCREDKEEDIMRAITSGQL